MYWLLLLFLALTGCYSKPESGVTAPAPIILEKRSLDEKHLTKKKKPNDVVLSQLNNASMVFAVPESANIDEDIKAQLLIDPTTDAEELAKNLKIKGKVVKSKIKISKVAVASIFAPDFEVKNITPEEQVLLSDTTTEWLWLMKPKTAGTHEISIVITALIKVDGDETAHHLKTFDKTITIEITHMQILQQWWSKYWQWILSTILLPILLWYLKEKKSKKD